MSTLQEPARTNRADVLRFVLYSAIGIFAFFVPFTIGDSKSTILLDHIVSWITTTLGEGTRYLALFAIIAGTVYQFVSGRWKEDYPRMAFAALSGRVFIFGKGLFLSIIVCILAVSAGVILQTFI